MHMKVFNSTLTDQIQVLNKVMVQKVMFTLKDIAKQTAINTGKSAKILVAFAFRDQFSRNNFTCLQFLDNKAIFRD